jgi:tetratricopeptide (TPR) repeat protein
MSVTIVFFPVFYSAYMLNFDDNSHLLYNTLFNGSSWRTAFDIFTSPDNANKTYIPLTMLTFFYEHMLWGFHSGISHGINLCLHLAVCAMAVVFGRALGLKHFAVYAGVLLFAIHPMHVEPVAWVTARKDLLYSFFYLSSLVAYLRYIDGGKGRDYIFALVAAALSVLSKPMALSLPLVLFLLDWYRGRPLSWKLFLDKIPFFCVVEPVAMVTYVMNVRSSCFSWSYSPLIWVWCAVFYVQKFFIPFDLVPIYTIKLPVTLHNPEYLYSFLFCLIFFLALWTWRRNKFFIFSVVFYVLSLFFIWRQDIFDLTFVADRFMYLPSIGICFLLGIAAEKYREMQKGRRWRWLLLLIGLFLSLLSYRQAGFWKNTFLLWSRNIQYNESPFLYNAYAESLFDDNCFRDNKQDFIAFLSVSKNTSAAKFKDVYAGSLDSKVDAARKLLALTAYYRAIRLDPNYQDFYSNIGIIYLTFKRYDRSMQFLDRAIALGKGRPGSPFYYRGLVHEYLGMQDKALKDYHSEISLANYNQVTLFGSDTLIPAYLNRANIYRQRRQFDLAWNDVSWVLKMVPQHVKAYGLASMIARDMGNDTHVNKIQELQRSSIY